MSVYRTRATMTKAMGGRAERVDSQAFRMLGVIWPLSMTTCMPRASGTTKAVDTRPAAPAISVSMMVSAS